MISTTKDTSDITRSSFSVALICQVVTYAFDACRLEMAIIFGMPTSLTFCILSNIPSVFGPFEFYFTLLYIFYTDRTKEQHQILCLSPEKRDGVGNDYTSVRGRKHAPYKESTNSKSPKKERQVKS
jgi:hypothetical protein